MLLWCPAGDSTLPRVAVPIFRGPASTEQQEQKSFSALKRFKAVTRVPSYVFV